MLNFVIVMVVEVALFSCRNSGIHNCTDRKFSDLNNTHNVVLPSEDPNKFQVHPECLNDNVSTPDIHFSP